MERLTSTTVRVLPQRIYNILALAVLSAIGMMSLQSPVTLAASMPTFTVTNASVGVYFRNSPHTADTDRVSGHGGYNGNVIQLKCYAFGDAVGDYNNTLWYYVINLTHPYVPNTNAPNVGFLNAHYINDGMSANQVDAGVPQCSVPTSSPTISEGASAFFIPRPAGFTIPFTNTFVPNPFSPPWLSTTADINVLYSTWAPGGCKYGGGVTNPYQSRWVSILGGWSNGRLGPVYYLANATSDQKSHIHYVLLIDPGAKKEFDGSCDGSVKVGTKTTSAAHVLDDWLSHNQSNHLMIIAAKSTLSDSSYQGLKDYYLQNIKSDGLMNQVTICSNDIEHEDAFKEYAINPTTSLISNPSDSCPNGSNEVKR